LATGWRSELRPGRANGRRGYTVIATALTAASQTQNKANAGKLALGGGFPSPSFVT